jgi:aminopeptidase N
MPKRSRPALRALLALVSFGAGPLVADTYPRQPGLDVQGYTFRLGLRDETDAIEAEAEIELRVLADGLASLALDLACETPERQERGMRVTGVDEGGRALRFEHSGDRLGITLDPAGRDGELRRVRVRYRGIPSAGLLIARNRHGDRTFFSDNWPDKTRHWLPTVDHPYDKATSEFVVTAPAHYQVVSNGLLVEETDAPGGQRRTRWRQSVPIAPWLYCLGVARFAVEHRSPWRGRSVETWVFAQDRDAGFRVFAEPTVAALDFFESRIGPYAYERLANVQANSVRGGMEAATSIFYGPDAVDEARLARWRNVIVHEIAHQWWGNAVTQADWDDVWLSEGFATYFTHLFVEHAQGRDAFLAGLRADRDAIRAFDEKNPGYRIVHDNLSDMSKVTSGPGTYRKGGWTLHMLRGVVGDDAFWSGIREYYRRHANTNASTADFRWAMEQAAGMQLAWFFDEWLTRGGMLKVRARWVHEAAAKAVRLDVEQLQPGPPYRMPIEVAVEVAGEPGARLERVELREARQSFRIPAEREPRSVALDPRTLVLMDAEVVKGSIEPR